MTGSGAGQIQDQLALRSRLSDMTQLSPWIESLALRHAIPGNVQFAIELCLEEVVSNVIRHGYAGAENCSVVVQFAIPRSGYFEFCVEDEAPRFNPLDAPEPTALNPDDEIRVGGQGIRLMRQFANSVEYEPTPRGNRTRMGFSAVDSPTATK
ncbi:MAG: ATP-binding protein [Candidatus Acidiferrales bacterium]